MLAQGGMAEVWLAIDLTLDRKVAVKWLKLHLASDPVVAERFRREAIAAASLNHPNIVAVHDVFEQDGRQAVVMQLVEGKSLRQLLDTQKRLSPELTCHIGSCVAAALDHAHTAGFVHRDVKPGNIMITPDGRVLLTDFGIAKGLQSAEADLTSDNIMMGTAKYLSPEQVRGKKLDGRADLYSLGLVLYECLAGRVPFLGETDADTALARLQRDPTDLTRLRATLPTTLVVAVHQLLSRNPAHRPATGAEVVTTLRDAAREGPPEIDETPAERSDVAPVGRLRRAPSDLAGRATDRRRATSTRDDVTPATGARSTPAPSTPAPAAGGPAGRGLIPGEVGAVGLHTSGGPSDRTPPSGAPARGRPAKGLTHGWKPSFVMLAVLVTIGLVVAGLLWIGLRFGGEDAVTSTTALPADTAATAQGPDDGESGSETGDDVATAPAAVVTITAYDPDGDLTENDADAVLSGADGNPDTNWRTVCYSDRFLGGKRGVGLVVTFDALARDAVTVDVGHGPYQVEFFATDAETIPGTIDEWGDPLGPTAFADDPGTVVSPVPAEPSRHVLILLKELGNDAGCTSSNPYRGALGEIAVAGA